MGEFIETDTEVLYDQVITAMEKAVGEPLYPGDERRIFSEALVALIVSIYAAVNEACRNKMLQYARGNILDALGERTNTKRLQAVKSMVALRFSMESAIEADVVIPKGTRVTPDSSIYFATTDSAKIAAGALYVDVVAESEVAGAQYNGYAAGTINQMVDLVQYIDAVTNVSVSSGGDDGEQYTKEGDDNYRERIRLSVTKFTTAGPKGSYKYYALSANASIKDVAVTSPSPGVVLITPVCNGGMLPDDAVLEQVEKICSADDIRPMTDQVVVEAPTQIAYAVNIKYYTTAEDESSCIEAIEGSGGALDRYLDWQDTKLGRDINPDKLRSFCLSPENGTGCIRLDVISPSRTIINETEIAHNTMITVTHEVVEE